MELSPRYDAAATEARLLPEWERHGYFRAMAESSRPAFCIVIPPPNITGRLHMGHALNNTLQDALTRWKRMSGFNALWLPGTDHASIATQYVVEKKLREGGMERPRETLGREAFLAEVWKWKEEYGGIITQQLKGLGCSLDWSRERFTMDAGLNRAVRTTFARLHADGLVYRDNYLVNWCPRCGTTLADDEVDAGEKPGKLWHIRYPVSGEPGRTITVATTRPETMLGDVAVAVNPKDERYTDLIGKMLELPLTGRLIPVIADVFVAPEFGTGMVKITPAHDANDYEAGKRHGLPQINILTPDAKINEAGGVYAGLDRYVARKRVLADLEALGLVEKTADHMTKTASCYRCATAIEPYLSLQWFVRMGPLAEKARRAVIDGRLTFHPESRRADMLRWLDGIRDWAISRQLWWGHRIPAFYRGGTRPDGADAELIVPKTDAEYDALVAEAADPASGLRQDADVLDTWFSSALWPFSTLGWPDDTADLRTFYPTSVLSTGKDIIFFWVARMLMMGLHLMDDVPFHDVYFHPIVADENGKKMSKSLGNVIDPREMQERFGTDALRLGLAACASRDQHIAFSVKEMEGYRNFMNKLWNAARFILGNTADLHRHDLADAGPTDPAARAAMHRDDRWILSRHARAVRRINTAMAEFAFDDAVKAFREFFWEDFCDYYLELAKPRLYVKPHEDGTTPDQVISRTAAQGTLIAVLEGSMRLLHPFCPFITEDIWQAVRALMIAGDTEAEAIGAETAGDGGGVAAGGPDDTCGRRALASLAGAPSLCVAPWNGTGSDALLDEAAEADVDRLKAVLHAIRNIRGEMGLPPGAAAKVTVASPDAAVRAVVEGGRAFLGSLTKLGEVSVAAEATPKAFAATVVTDGVTVMVELPDDLRGAEADRLGKEIARLAGEEQRIGAKLSSPGFADKAPAALVEKEREKLAHAATDRQALEAKLDALKG